MVDAFKTTRKYFFSRRTPAKVYGNLKNVKSGQVIRKLQLSLRKECMPDPLATILTIFTWNARGFGSLFSRKHFDLIYFSDVTCNFAMETKL